MFDVCHASTGATSKYTVDASKGYAAFHFYNSGVANIFTVAIDEHSLWIFAVDGHYITPVNVNAINIEPGARISAFVPLVKKPANYIVRVSNPGVDQILFGTAVMSYVNGDSSYVSQPIINKVGQNNTSPFVYFDPNTSKYTSFPPSSPRSTSDITYHLDLGRFGTSWTWTLSGNEAYTAADEDSQPLLYNYNSQVGRDSNITITTKYGQWVDLIIHSEFPPSNPQHALHKHANKAYIIGYGTGAFTWPNVAAAQQAVPNSFNFANPPYRDGFLTPGANAGPAWMVIRYQANNPGAWIFHCRKSRLVLPLSMTC